MNNNQRIDITIPHPTTFSNIISLFLSNDIPYEGFPQGDQLGPVFATMCLHLLVLSPLNEELASRAQACLSSAHSHNGTIVANQPQATTTTAHPVVKFLNYTASYPDGATIQYLLMPVI
jgi:hypothetical protein